MIIFDILIPLILVGAFYLGWKRGLLRTLWGLIALILTIVITAVLHQPAVEMFRSVGAADGLNNYVYTTIERRVNTDGEADSILESLDNIYPLPDNMLEKVENRVDYAQENLIVQISEEITNRVIDISATIILLILVRLLLAAIYRIMHCILHLPLLKQTNKLAGGIIQLIIALTIIYGALALFAAAGQNISDGTVICSRMYNNNLLLRLLGM